MPAPWTRLKGRSLDELRVRLRQASEIALERAGLAADTRLPDDAAFFKRDVRDPSCANADSLLAHFRSHATPRFFSGLDDFRDAGRRAPELVAAQEQDAALIARAEHVLAQSFDLLGLHGLRFGDPIDWSCEPTTHKRTSLDHWSTVPYLDAELVGDKKITWELNRHHIFLTLGRAYLRTGDERYAQAFANHLDHWIASNPPKRGINWASSLEISLRSINWLWALHFFRDSTQLSARTFADAVKVLAISGRHISHFLSTYFSPNTHLTGEALGLFYLGTMMPFLRDAPAWRELGRRILIAEIDRQIRSDGVYFEQSTYYARYTADFYLHFIILADLNGIAVPSGVRSKVQLMLDFLMHITRPDGTTPLIGDDDGGRLAMLDASPADDFRSCLSTGAALFSRSDYKFVSGGLNEETVWLMGEGGVRAFAQIAATPPTETSRAFTAGGFFILRDGWTRDANVMTLDCGPHGALTAGHAHADVLAFDLSVRGRQMLVDAGTYTYTGDAHARDWFRGTGAHNALSIDGRDSSEPGDVFTWQTRASAELLAWATNDRFDFFHGRQDGYVRLSGPAVHDRSVLFAKGRYWIVRDRVETEAPHSYALNFHAAPGLHARANTATSGTQELQLRCAGAPLDGLDIIPLTRAGMWQQRSGRISQCYGACVAAEAWAYAADARGPVEFVTLLAPRGAGDAAMSIEEIEASGGRCFAFLNASDGSRDLLFLRSSGAAIEASVATVDADLAWMRWPTDAKAPQEIVVVGAQRLECRGHTIFSSPRRITCSMVASGDTFRIEPAAAA